MDNIKSDQNNLKQLSSNFKIINNNNINKNSQKDLAKPKKKYLNKN